MSMTVETEHYGHRVWHVEDRGIMMKLRSTKESTGPHTWTFLYECMSCHARARVGIGPDNRIIVRPEAA
jgi:hypothetical protein